MGKLFWQGLLIYLSILTYNCCTSAAIATEINHNKATNTDKIQIDSIHLAQTTTLTPSPVKESENNSSMAQVTSVSQLSDVQPTDWAFLALLVVLTSNQLTKILMLKQFKRELPFLI